MALASCNCDVSVEVWLRGEVELNRGGVEISSGGVAVGPMIEWRKAGFLLRALVLLKSVARGGESGNKGKDSSPESVKRTSDSR